MPISLPRELFKVMEFYCKGCIHVNNILRLAKNRGITLECPLTKLLQFGSSNVVLLVCKRRKLQVLCAKIGDYNRCAMIYKPESVTVKFSVVEKERSGSIYDATCDLYYKVDSVFNSLELTAKMKRIGVLVCKANVGGRDVHNTCDVSPALRFEMFSLRISEGGAEQKLVIAGRSEGFEERNVDINVKSNCCTLRYSVSNIGRCSGCVVQVNVEVLIKGARIEELSLPANTVNSGKESMMDIYGYF